MLFRSENVNFFRGFVKKWIGLVEMVIYNITLSTRIMMRLVPKGLKQGDPISPILLNLGFFKMLEKAARHTIISCLLPRVSPGDIISLQYGDDTLIFLEENDSKARNLKWKLSCFEAMSSLKIIFQKTNLL